MNYNGWKNYETWNVALWLGNDEGLYYLVKDCKNYDEVVDELTRCGIHKTPDGVMWKDSILDFDELNDMIGELS